MWTTQEYKERMKKWTPLPERPPVMMMVMVLTIKMEEKEETLIGFVVSTPPQLHQTGRMKAGTVIQLMEKELLFLEICYHSNLMTLDTFSLLLTLVIISVFMIS